MNLLELLNFLCLNLVIFWVLFFVYKPWKKKIIDVPIVNNVNIVYDGYYNNTQILTSQNILNSTINVYTKNYYDQWRPYKYYYKNQGAMYDNLNYTVLADKIIPNSDINDPNPDPETDQTQWKLISLNPGPFPGPEGTPIQEYFLYLETLDSFNYNLYSSVVPVTCVINNFSNAKDIQIRNYPGVLSAEYSTAKYDKNDQTTFNNWNFIQVNSTNSYVTLKYDNSTQYGPKQKITGINYNSGTSKDVITVENHGYITGQYVRLENTNSSLNGPYQILVLTEDTFQITVSNSTTTFNDTSVTYLVPGCIGFDLPAKQSVKLEFYIKTDVKYQNVLNTGTIYVT